MPTAPVHTFVALRVANLYTTARMADDGQTLCAMTENTAITPRIVLLVAQTIYTGLASHSHRESLACELGA